MLTRADIVPGALFTNADPTDGPLTLTVSVSAMFRHTNQWTLARLEHLPWARDEVLDDGSMIMVPNKNFKCLWVPRC